MRGMITGIDGMVGIYIFSIFGIVLLTIYAQAVNSSGTSVMLSYARLKSELSMQHTLYIIDNSDQTLPDILGASNMPVYNYVRIGPDLAIPVYNRSMMDRIAVSDGRLYIISVNG